jgi:poly [ADP-ribose] polymerase 2/3/4
MYYSLIPHDFGRRRPPVISDSDRLKREIELLESLSDMRIADEILRESSAQSQHDINPLDAQYNGLNMAEMAPLDGSSKEFKEIQDYLCQSVGTTHGFKYKVEDIFRLERNGEFERFENSEFRKIAKKNRRLLWVSDLLDYVVNNTNID